LNKFRFIFCIVLMISLRVTGVFCSILSKFLVDYLIDSQNGENKSFPIFLLLTFSLVLFLDGFYISNGVLNSLRLHLWSKLTAKIEAKLRKRLFFIVQKYKILFKKIRFYFKCYIKYRFESLPLNWHIANKGEESQHLIVTASESIFTWIR